MEKDPRAPSNIFYGLPGAPVIQTKVQLRAYILEQLPGWLYWLQLALRTLETRTLDEVLLCSRAEIHERIDRLAGEMLDELGPRGEQIGRAYLQKRPFFDISNQRALELPTRWQGEGHELQLDHQAAPDDGLPRPATERGVRPFSHRQLGGKVVSRDLIGNLLAYALRARTSVGHGAGLQQRRRWAAQMVACDIGPFIREKLDPDERVLPDGLRDPALDQAQARAKPVSVALAAVVVVYLGVPSEDDPEWDPERQLTPRAHKRAQEMLSAALREPDPTVWSMRQGVV